MNAWRLAEWTASFQLPHEAPETEKARDHLLDMIAVMLAANAEEESARIAREWAAPSGAGPCALITPGGTRVDAEHAAFANAVAGHSIELDDVHNASSMHPGVVVIPAAIAVAEEVQARGHDLLEAVVAGYEVMLRIGEAAGPSATYGRGFHPTAVCGAFASAAAAGVLMKLGPEKLVHAFGLAWSFASGNMSFQTEGSWAKRFQVGHAASCGIRAAKLAQLGATGPSHVFEAHGFFHGYAGTFDPERLLAGLGGGRLKIMECGLKPYACCRYNQTVIDGLLELRRGHDLTPEMISRIELSIPTTGLALVANPAEAKRAPKTPVEAQFSIYHAAAVAIAMGAAGRSEFREPFISSAAIHALAARISCGGASDVDYLYPRQWAARIRIWLRGGGEIEKFFPHCLGDPEKPLQGRDLAHKIEGLLKGHVTGHVIRDFIAYLHHGARPPSPSELIHSLIA